MSDHKMKIIRSAKNIFDTAKDNTVSNIVNYAVKGDLQIDRVTLEKITKLIQISLDESFQRGVSTFEKEIDNYGSFDSSFFFKKNSP